MNKKNNKEDIVIYKSKNKDIQLEVSVGNETVWLTQVQMTKLFNRERSVLTKHINNIFREGELHERRNVQNVHIPNSDKPVKTYSLDVVISVGYRVKSLEGTRFRQWANKILKEHILNGYTINYSRVKTNYSAFLSAVSEVKKLLSTSTKIDNQNILELVTMFADTWFSLYAYDKGNLVTYGITKKKIILTADKLYNSIFVLKQILILKGEASELFGIEKHKDSVAGIIGNIMQSFDNQDIYKSIEEKAAHLLYFMIKDHPFIDGNKRCAAYAFIWFLQQANALNVSRITSSALTALTLLIAESDPKDKNRIVGLICLILK
jgi:prophage maintenance system killer protein